MESSDTVNNSIMNFQIELPSAAEGSDTVHKSILMKMNQPQDITYASNMLLPVDARGSALALPHHHPVISIA